VANELAVAKLTAHGAQDANSRLPALTVAALGIVFGDIGTSPLYTLQTCLIGDHPAGTEEASVLGVLSLIFWALTLVVTIKYLIFIMRADNHGEGGILALLALIPEKLRTGKGGGIGVVALLVIAGAALLYGDGMITPAISVLSAMEGLDDPKTHAFKPYILPITCAVLVVLFLIQRRGTGDVGKFFGPVMAVWFLTIGVLGAFHVAQNPAILSALSPHHGLSYVTTHGWQGFFVLGGVVLAVTGGEALYADMGHFGPRPIRLAWLALVFPSLILCYFGQGALVLAHPSVASENVFFALVPQGPYTFALVLLSAAATVIASQALISGAFSLTHQAVQLGFFPRITVKHTSSEAEGQIYVPEINWLLAVVCIALVLSFKESARLAAAYGIAVTGTMGITSVVYFVVLRGTWNWPLAKALPLLLLFLSFDIPFFLSNAIKFLDGGWVPILIGACFFAVMVIWRIGRRHLRDLIVQRSPPLKSFLKDCTRLVRVPGAAVFMASLSEGVPPVMQQHAERIGCLHETIFLVTVHVEHAPTVSASERMKTESLGHGIYRVIAHYGFMETPIVPDLLAAAVKTLGLDVDPKKVTYYLGRETFLATEKGKMGPVIERIFAFMARNARTATSYFAIPSEQVVELGSQIDL
jgi:KUP system potassium uptake protein